MKKIVIMASNKQSVTEDNRQHIVPEYDILRVLVTLLVIIGHSTYYCISTPYGGCDYTSFTLAGLSLFERLAAYVTKLIYLFHMPLYMALSGALYRLKNLRGGYYSYKGLITDKVKKLLIPFIDVTLLYSVPLKYISGYYNNSNNIFKDIFVGQVLIQGNSHLWFLPALFMIFIIIYFLEKFIKADFRVILSVLFALSFVSFKIPILIIQYTFEYAFWFYVGYCFENIRERINQTRKTLVIILCLGTVAFILTVLLPYYTPEYSGIDIYDIIDRTMTYMSAIFGCFAVYASSFLLSRTNLVHNSLIKIVRNNSLSLYLYSDTWNYVILNISAGLFGSAIFITNIGAVSLCVGRIIITFSFALLVSTVLKKLKIKYIC